jgi:hypothetical protein
MEHARKPFTLFEYMLLRRFLESVLQLRAIAFQLYVSLCRIEARYDLPKIQYDDLT